MEFVEISSRLPDKLVEEASQRLSQLACELATREDNHHVGSGLGGNTLQLCVLQGWGHRLDTVARKIDVGNKIVWDANFLAHAPMVAVRKRLDWIFPRITRLSRSWLPSQQLSTAMETCESFAKGLDAGTANDAYFTLVGNKMSTFPPEIVLAAVRTKIRIERLVRHNLDEHPAWADSFTRINKTVG